MFGTLSYHRDSEETIFKADPTFPTSISSKEPSRRGTTIHKACELCRARKLRCSGDPSGCDRCKSSSSDCKYPPRIFRSRTKRGSTSRISEHGSVGYGMMVEDNGASSHSADALPDREFGQIDWHNPSVSAEVEAAAQEIYIQELLEASYGLNSELTDVFASSGNAPSNASEYSFGDLLESPWMDNQEARRKMRENLETLRDTSSSHFESSDLLSAGTLISGDWSDTTVGTTPEISSTSSRSNSVETARTYSGREDTNVQTDERSCQCLSLIARLLEQVETQVTISDTSIDSMLESCGEPLRQSKILLDCLRCKSRSECILLLTMLAKSLTTVCNGLVQRYVQSRPQGSQPLASTNKWPEIRLGAYCVEDGAERSMVVEALIAAKLNSLHYFVVELKARANRREGPLILLLQIEQRIKDLKNLMPDIC